MIVDRATLERVAELLAEMRESTAMRARDWMRADDAWKSVRGLLAEPQADDTHPCHDCGERYFERMGSYWLADDALWQLVVVTGTIALCPRCFAERASEAGVPIYWRAVAEPQVNPSEAESLSAALREAWLGESMGRRHALHGPTHNCSPDVCMIGQCPTIRGLLASATSVSRRKTDARTSDPRG